MAATCYAVLAIMVSFLQQTLVLIPALNEAESIAATVYRWKDLGVRWVRVVDNGSSDTTSTIAEAAGAEVLFEPARGYGAAAWRGLQDLPMEVQWILFSSADGSDRLTPDEIMHWQKLVNERFDLIVGDRVTPHASRQQLKSAQSFGNRLCCQLIALGWGRRFNDMGSLRLIRRASIESLQLKDRSFGWNVEMQVRALEHRMRIVEVPVSYHPRTAGESKISGSFAGTIRAGFSILSMMLHLWRSRQRS